VSGASQGPRQQSIEETQMPAQESPGGRRIVVGIDGSGSSVSALRWAIWQAGLAAAAVDAVIAWHYPDLAASGMAVGTIKPAYGFFRESAGKIVADAVSSTLDPASDVPVRARVAQGHAAQVLLDAPPAPQSGSGPPPARNPHPRAKFSGQRDRPARRLIWPSSGCRGLAAQRYLRRPSDGNGGTP
jgi:hypothetical protein